MSCEAWLQKSAAVMRGSRGGVGVVRTPSPPWKMKIMKIYQVYIVKLSQICLKPPPSLANTIILQTPLEKFSGSAHGCEPGHFV